MITSRKNPSLTFKFFNFKVGILQTSRIIVDYISDCLIFFNFSFETLTQRIICNWRILWALIFFFGKQFANITLNLLDFYIWKAIVIKIKLNRLSIVFIILVFFVGEKTFEFLNLLIINWLILWMFERRILILAQLAFKRY